MPFTRPITAVAMLILMNSAGLAANEAPNVHSTAPVQATRNVELEEIWRIGGEDADLIFGLMIDARCDADGNVYLLDHQLSTVTMVSPTGEIVATLGGEGDGPGECRMPQTLTLMPDGTVGLGQRFPGKFITVTRDNLPGEVVNLGGENAAQTGFTMLVSGRYRGGTFLAGSLHQVPGETGQSRNTYLHGITPTGEVITQYAEHLTYLDLAKAHLVERDMVAPFIAAHTVGPDGKVYLAPERNRYLVEVRNPDGSLDKVVSRVFSNPERDRQTLDRINALFEEQDRASAINFTWEVEKYDQTVAELIVTKENQLLVSHSRSGLDLPEGIFTSYDVFAADGRWQQELHVRCDADQDHDGLIFLDDGRVLLVKGLQLARLTASGNGGNVTEEEGGAWAQEVICCRLKD